MGKSVEEQTKESTQTIPEDGEVKVFVTETVGVVAGDTITAGPSGITVKDKEGHVVGYWDASVVDGYEVV